MAASANLEDRVIAGRYRIVSKFGEGGMGSVWRAEHLTLGSEIAIKLIDPTVAKHPEVRARFMREAQAAAQLRSPHVVQILDYGIDEDTPFIAMELMEGESLADRLEHGGRLSPVDTSRIVTEVARALGKAHEAGIVHRDLKPDNIFLVKNDDVEIAKVLDFGVAKVTAFGSESAGMTSTGAVLGTPYYMSPEQAEGLKDLDHRTDLWALAVIAYECLLGVRPFVGDTLGAVFLSICTRPKPTPSLVSEVPPGFDAWFDKGTSRVVADRFTTARELAQALRGVCDRFRITDTDPQSLNPATTRTQLAHSNTIASSDRHEAFAQSPVAEIPAPLGLSTAGVGALSVPMTNSTKKGVPLWGYALGGASVLAAVVAWGFVSSGEDMAEEVPLSATQTAPEESAVSEESTSPKEDVAAPVPPSDDTLCFT